MLSMRAVFFSAVLAFLCLAPAAHAADMKATTDAAEKGDAAAQSELGNFYRWGDDKTDPDYKKAEEWYRKAAEQGFAEAENGLGELYTDGNGIQKDPAEALKWLSKAAEQGNRPAQMNLASIYVNGTGTVRNIEEACFWATVANSADTPVMDLNAAVDIRRTLCPEKLTPYQQDELKKRVDMWNEAHPAK
jgi:TPR repeat protein